ncbi:MAG: hypothetical protein KF799_16110 [Bdellovibrionales bacterium]|nr:hypothetical protein [Bdellovibrionales bacterium]
MRLTALYTVLALVLPSPAFAFFQMDFMKGKTESKASSRWTLSDWLSQKNKMRLADQWLMANRAGDGWFEFNPSATTGSYKVSVDSGSGSTSVTRNSQKYTLDMYVSLLNLYAEYEKSGDDLEEYGGAVGLRVFGASSQTTNLVARYGFQRSQSLSTQERWDNPYAEGLLQLYILQNFGLNGQYRYFFPKDSNHGERLEGHRTSAGAFLEFLFVRFYANFYQQPMKRTSGGTVTTEKRDGYEAGARFFF